MSGAVPGAAAPAAASEQPGWVDWEMWDGLIRMNGITIERPSGSAHPRYSDIIYPIDYGYVNGTLANDGEEVDIFVGTADAGRASGGMAGRDIASGLVAAVFTHDPRKGDREVKFLYGCTPREIYLVNGFVNFAPMSGQLLLRQPMRELWRSEAR
ncbi:MAG: hypothetical protein COV99_07420 [Bacteroidetes bacterium CG12_big_fil_rev_8_21_14_0_65_60_17]|nr:MAG: hypothetical protein COV99_07420 [Bacteroidetes bacterium CG12_big_fil_rev_8_21_14_0_65_60_17]